MPKHIQVRAFREIRKQLIIHTEEIITTATEEHKKYLGVNKTRVGFVKKSERNHVVIIKKISHDLIHAPIEHAVVFRQLGEKIAADSVKDGLTIEEAVDGIIFLKQAIWKVLKKTDVFTQLTLEEFYWLSQTIATYCDIIASKITFTYHELSIKTEEQLNQVVHMVELSEDAIISLDMKGRITSWNTGAQHIYGYTKREVVEKTLSMLIPENKKNDFPMIIGQLKAGNRVDHYITQRITKDKKIIDVSISFSPIRNSKGKLIGASKIARDITENIKIRNQLAHLASLVASSGDSIWSIDKEGKVVSWNKGAEILYGYVGKEVIGKKPDFLIAPEHVSEFYKLKKKIFAGETIENYDSARIRKNGAHVDVSVSMSPVRNNYGDIEGISIVARDITERKKLEQRKDDFIALASHELKTPVTSLKMFAQVLASRFKKEGDFASAKYMESMDTQINKLTEIVNGLLDVSRVHQGKLMYKKEPFAIDELVHQTIESVQLVTNSHTLEVNGNSKRMVIGDKDRIEQVLTNLINNAVKYSPKANKVVIELKNQNGNVLVSVTDFGMGIPKRDETRIFDRFFQVDTPIVKTYPGLGLGLYISKEIVARHGGKLWVESMEGKGSTFYILLPTQN